MRRRRASAGLENRVEPFDPSGLRCLGLGVARLVDDQNTLVRSVDQPPLTAMFAGTGVLKPVDRCEPAGLGYTALVRFISRQASHACIEIHEANGTEAARRRARPAGRSSGFVSCWPSLPFWAAFGADPSAKTKTATGDAPSGR